MASFVNDVPGEIGVLWDDSAPGVRDRLIDWIGKL